MVYKRKNWKGRHRGGKGEGERKRDEGGGALVKGKLAQEEVERRENSQKKKKQNHEEIEKDGYVKNRGRYEMWTDNQ